MMGIFALLGFFGGRGWGGGVKNERAWLVIFRNCNMPPNQTLISKILFLGNKSCIPLTLHALYIYC